MSTPSFAQQGQLDWVSLSQMSMTCTLDVAARIMNAGLDMCTPMVGRGLCSSFSFPTSGQLLLRASLDQLITVRTSVGRILEFGFGLKSTVYTLCETEQGSFCVALSAALALPYTSFQAAQIWREYCILRGTPANFNPSVHQWTRLVDVCSGSLHKSNFRHHFDAFSRTLCPEASPSNLAAPPAEVAKALTTLADLSQGKISNAVFVGGIECAWLAAVAKCLLCMPIEVYDKSGHCSYRFMPSPGACFQATFKPDDHGRNQDSNSALVQRTCFVTSGTTLLHERVDFLTSVIRHRSSWSTILSDSFSSWNLFQKSAAAKCFGILLQLVASQAEECFFNPSSNTNGKIDFPWWLHWNSEKQTLLHPRRTGQVLLDFAYGLFPELQAFPRSLEAAQGSSSLWDRISHSLQQIKGACGCTRCAKGSHEARTRNSTGGETLCFERLALTVVRLILILSPVTVCEDIPPSPAALRQLYICTFGPEQQIGETTPHTGVELVSYLFTCQFIANEVRLKDHFATAFSVGGVCVYSTLLKAFDSSPIDAISIEIIPGHIKYGESTYRAIIDMESFDTSPATSPEKLFQQLSETYVGGEKPHIELKAEETQYSGLISVSYRLFVTNKVDVWIKPGELHKLLSSILRFHKCSSPQGCQNTFQHNASKLQWTARPGSCTTLTDTNPTWSIVDWSSWTTKIAHFTRRLEIDVIPESDTLILFLLIWSQYRRHLAPKDDIYSGCTITQLPTNIDCIVGATLSYWSKTIYSSIPQDDMELIVRRRCLTRIIDDEVCLQLATNVGRQSRWSHQTPWNIFRRQS